MNTQELHDAISLLDEELIRDVDLIRHNAPMPNRRIHIKKYICTAACLCVIVIGTAAFTTSDSFSKFHPFIEQFRANDSKYGNSDQDVADNAEIDTYDTGTDLSNDVEKAENESAYGKPIIESDRAHDIPDVPHEGITGDSANVDTGNSTESSSNAPADSPIKSTDPSESAVISITVEVMFVDETSLKGLIIRSDYSFEDNEIVFKLTDTTYEAAKAAAVGSKATVVCKRDNIFEEYVIPTKITINEGE